MNLTLCNCSAAYPPTWDTTIITHAKIAGYIVTARRHGSDWFIAGITDSAARDLTLPLSFLPNGNYTATIYKDGINAERNAIDYMIEEKTLTANHALNLHIAPAGEFMIRLTKK